jgi:hypothetical protein
MYIWGGILHNNVLCIICKCEVYRTPDCTKAVLMWTLWLIVNFGIWWSDTFLLKTSSGLWLYIYTGERYTDTLNIIWLSLDIKDTNFYNLNACEILPDKRSGLNLIERGLIRWRLLKYEGVNNKVNTDFVFI